jgi:transcriptional regulator with GAF, ATPase, and Fis domain
VTQFIQNLFFALIFIFLLILLFRIKDKAFIENKDSYRYTLRGMIVLTGVSLLRLIGHSQFFMSLPFLSEPIYKELVEAIGMITGLTLMIAGVSIWLPIKKKRDNRATRALEIFKFLDNFEESMGEADNINRIFHDIPEFVCRNFGLASSAVFRLNHKRGRFICTDHYNIDTGSRENLKNEEILSGQEHEPFGNIIEKYAVDYYLPLKVKDSVCGALLFWKETGAEISPEIRQALERVGRILSGRLALRFDNLKKAFYAECLNDNQKAAHIIQSRTDLKGNLKLFHTLFHNAVGAEYFSLMIPDKHPKNFRRFIAGLNGHILLEGATNPSMQNTYIDAVIDYRRSLLLDTVDNHTEMAVDSLFISCGQKSLIAVPIVNYGRVIAVLTLGHPRSEKFNYLDLTRAEMLAAAISPAIEADISRRANFERDRYLGALAAFEATIQECREVDTLLSAAAELMLQNIGTTMVRIAIFGADRSELITKALRTIRPFKIINSENVGLSREFTPWHYMVMNENRPLLINQSDLESYMDPGETAALVFAGMQSALIVPIVIGGQTYGLITLGEMRQWERFSYDSAAISFCKGLAAKIANGLRLIQMGRVIMETGESRESSDKIGSNSDNIYRELKTPLSSLQGSIDLLKVKGYGQEEDSGKIIAMMEKSTNRMISILNQD